MDGSKNLADSLGELVRGHRILAMEGHEEVILGHLSWRAPDGRGFWMKRHGIAMAEVMGIEDLVLVAFDGEKLEGSGDRHSEWPIHSEIYRARPDVQSVAHTHAFYSTLFSTVQKPLRAIAHAGSHFQENVPRYTATAHLVRTPEVGRELAATLGGAAAVFMRSHGVTFCGRSIAHCVILGYFLERACHQQLVLDGSGLPWDGSTEEEVRSKGPNLMTDKAIGLFWNYLSRKLQKYEAGVGVSAG